MVLRGACIVLRLLSRQGTWRNPSLLAADGLPWQIAGTVVEQTYLQRVVNAMDDAGARYLLLEKRLGRGASFVLGTSLSESQ